MGRRGRKRGLSSSIGESDEDDDALERRYYKANSTTSNNEEEKDEDDPSSATKKRRREEAGELEKQIANDVASTSTTGNGSASTADGGSKIDQLRLKKQKRKEIQKAKKAAKRQAAVAEESQRIQAQKDVQSLKQKKAEAKQKERLQSTTNNQNFQTLRKGVQYMDVVVGNGPVVEPRKKVRVKYVLRAKNKYGKVLDRSDNFGFRLGRGEVIEGWDIGVSGMRGGSRRFLIVPPQAGYGLHKNVGAGVGGILFFDITVL